MIFDKLCGLISEQFGVEADTITVDTTFEDDLGADSLDIVELSMALEEAFGVGISDEDLPNIKTVNDILEYIQSKQQ